MSEWIMIGGEVVIRKSEIVAYARSSTDDRFTLVWLRGIEEHFNAKMSFGEFDSKMRDDEEGQP